MISHAISLKSRVRYEGRAQNFDRRPLMGADLEKLPDRIWRTMGLVLRSQVRRSAQGVAAKPGKR